jgi:hypothetical protein
MVTVTNGIKLLDRTWPVRRPYQSDLLINLPALLLILNISSCFEKKIFFFNIVQEIWAASNKHFLFSSLPHFWC